jgi:hypothetical protein
VDERFPAPVKRIRAKKEEELLPHESPEERDSRLRIEESRAGHEIWKERVIIAAFVTSLAVILVVAVGVLVFSGDPTTKNWATTALMSVLMGIVGFFTGKTVK